MRKNAKILSGLKGKLRPWLRAFLDETNPDTFLNKTASVRAANYKCKDNDSERAIGYQNFTKLHDRIETWLDEEGLSTNRLKMKLLSLIDAKQVHFHKVKGQVKSEDLPPGVMVMAESNKMSWAGKGEDAEPVDDGDTLVAVSVEALETQRRSLDMAFKIRGEYAPEKHEHTGKDGERLFNDFSDEERADLKSMAREMAAKAAKTKD